MLTLSPPNSIAILSLEMILSSRRLSESFQGLSGSGIYRGLRSANQFSDTVYRGPALLASLQRTRGLPAPVVLWLASRITELEGLGSNPISHSGVFRFIRSAPTQSELAMGSMGRLGPHSLDSSTLRMCRQVCCSGNLTNTTGACRSRAWFKPG